MNTNATSKIAVATRKVVKVIEGVTSEVVEAKVAESAVEALQTDCEVKPPGDVPLTKATVLTSTLNFLSEADASPWS